MKKRIQLLVALLLGTQSMVGTEGDSVVENKEQEKAEVRLFHPELHSEIETIHPEIEKLLEIKASPDHMIASLERIDSKEWVLFVEDERQSLVSHQFRDLISRVGNDVFQHEIYYNLNTKEYWILRTGGFVGVHDVYGPGKLDK